MSQDEAKKHLAVAKKQLERVQLASWEPDDLDREDAVTWGFYAYENGVIAVVEKAGMDWRRTHWDKLELADRIHQQGLVSVTVRRRLEELNELRKDVYYAEVGEDLKEYDLENLATDLEDFLAEVQELVDS